MPGDMNLDRLNCSVIEVGGKPAMPVFIRLMLAMKKRLLVIYDSDSHLTIPNAIAHNEKLCADIRRECEAGGVDYFVCDPYLEIEAGLADDSVESKQVRMRVFLEQVVSWNEVAWGLQSLMDKISAFARGLNGQGICEKDGPPGALEPTNEKG